MLTFLFWNVAKADASELITALATEHSVDVFVLAECETPAYKLCATLNRESPIEFFAPPSNSAKVSLLTRFSTQFVTPLFEGNRYSIQAVNLPGKAEFLLAGVHLPSKLVMSEQSQQFECYKLSKNIRQVEQDRNHSRTVLVGDFNMNPFEAGMVAAGGLHGVMSREVALRQSRIVQAESYSYFYNPMWSCLGDVPSGPPGTMYYERAEDVCHFWNMFDQVLIRPALIPSFEAESLSVLTTAASKSLLNEKGKPDSKKASDHLPILFKLQI